MAAALTRTDSSRDPRSCIIRNDTSRSLLCGGVAGCISKTATAPLSRLTVLAQTSTLLSRSAGQGPARNLDLLSSGSVRSGLLQIVKHEGFRALWKGNLCTCLHRFPYTGVNFAVFQWFTARFPLTCRRSPWGPYVPGAVSGCIAVTACYPLEILRTRLMTQPGHQLKLHQCMMSILREGGFLGMYAGLRLSLAVAVPAISISFGVFSLLKENLATYGVDQKSLVGTSIAGGTSGVIAAAMVYPLDTLRRRRQLSVQQHSWIHEARHIYKHEGHAGFWRGMRPEVLKAFPTVSIFFVAYEVFQTALLA